MINLIFLRMTNILSRVIKRYCLVNSYQFEVFCSLVDLKNQFQHFNKLKFLTIRIFDLISYFGGARQGHINHY